MGRDPATIGRSAGIVVEPTAITGFEERDLGGPIGASSAEIAERLHAIQLGGFTQLEVLRSPATPDALDAMRPVLERLDAGRGDTGRPGPGRHAD